MQEEITELKTEAEALEKEVKELMKQSLNLKYDPDLNAEIAKIELENNELKEKLRLATHRLESSEAYQKQKQQQKINEILDGRGGL